MPVDTLLTYALAVIGALLTMLIALVVYVFISLKGQVRDLAVDMTALTHSRIKLIHKDDCRSTTHRLQEQIDEQHEQISSLAVRVTRAETLLDIEDHCS